MESLTQKKVTKLLKSNPDCECTFVDGVFYEFEYVGRLDGKPYYCNSQQSANEIPEGKTRKALLAININSTQEQRRTAINNFFLLIEYKGALAVVDRKKMPL